MAQGVGGGVRRGGRPLPVRETLAASSSSRSPRTVRVMRSPTAWRRIRSALGPGDRQAALGGSATCKAGRRAAGRPPVRPMTVGMRGVSRALAGSARPVVHHPREMREGAVRTCGTERAQALPREGRTRARWKQAPRSWLSGAGPGRGLWMHLWSGYRVAHGTSLSLSTVRLPQPLFKSARGRMSPSRRGAQRSDRYSRKQIEWRAVNEE